jgi:hypothetical protein
VSRTAWSCFSTLGTTAHTSIIWLVTFGSWPALLLLHGRCGGRGVWMMVICNSDVLLLASSNQGLEWLRETGVGVGYSPHRPLFALIRRLGLVVTAKSKVNLSFVDFRRCRALMRACLGLERAWLIVPGVPLEASALLILRMSAARFPIDYSFNIYTLPPVPSGACSQPRETNSYGACPCSRPLRPKQTKT